MTRPNILLFMADNQPADLLGCYGNDEVHTPHLDGMARRGVRFDSAYCVNAMCSPCRASVLTGLMPSQHGIHNWLDDKLLDHWPTNWSAIGEFANIPTIIKQAGYATALIGKFHLGVPFVPQLAFDHWVTFPHGHTTSFYGNEVIDQEERYRFEGHTVDYFTDKTIEYLEHRAGQDDPFFAFVPYNGPYGHWPAIKGRSETEFAALYDDTDMHSVPREGLSSDVLERFGLRVAEGGVREQFKGPLLLPNNVESLRNYFAQVSLIDSGVGRILATLERLKLDDDTIVIYTSDHGFSLGHNGVWGHGAAAFPASAHRPSYHIPLIISGGGLEENIVHDGLVSQIDLFPTLAALVGAERARPSLQSPARDLGPVLRGEEAEGADAVFYEQEETRAIRTREWLYAMRFKGSETYPMEDEMYCLTDDPREKANLIRAPEFAEKAAELRDRITTFFDAYTAPAYDLWQGGAAKSNVTFAGLWQDAWGEGWAPEFSG
ncbi:sulfatase-like hydrolase/transferase [Alisedimentitalea sp. MJ-SS2]|uniref:sulfatase family protein n=1 Tax=Aliisedimentitalea sp. MJ-SS2 TaxID=3049795 RepID=UPI002912F6CC|nr:sulfatase-like hydrolase/transferase [Alisedimentitalea sp. MJ-SS2]MDU8926181.1 sulfatase-like hydrolase/transferase [Alisedimentitalea sp. MJ-SS2]